MAIDISRQTSPDEKPDLLAYALFILPLCFAGVWGLFALPQHELAWGLVSIGVGVVALAIFAMRRNSASARPYSFVAGIWLTLGLLILV